MQAQDRLFQMDLWRRSVQGRLSEVLGAELRRARRDDAAHPVPRRRSAPSGTATAPTRRAIATAFVRGVNAWIALARERSAGRVRAGRLEARALARRTIC